MIPCVCFVESKRREEWIVHKTSMYIMEPLPPANQINNICNSGNIVISGFGWRSGASTRFSHGETYKSIVQLAKHTNRIGNTDVKNININQSKSVKDRQANIVESSR